MPSVVATATLAGVSAQEAATVIYTWEVALVFTGGAGCAHSARAFTRHADIRAAGPSSVLRVPFTQVRGGKLDISVTAQVGGTILKARSEGLEVTGTNPLAATLAAAANGKPDRFKKLIRLESGLRQFRSPTCPLFSADNYLGVGLSQITPFTSADQVWNWKANLDAGWSLWNEKVAAARDYPAHIRASAEWISLVKRWNARNALALARTPPQQAPAVAPSSFGGHGTGVSPSGTGGLIPYKPVRIDIPAFTDEQEQRDALRGFNGWAAGLHEYRIKLDAAGLPVVTLDATGLKGTAQWEWVSGDLRRAFYAAKGITAKHQGDPDYVTHVEKLAAF